VGLLHELVTVGYASWAPAVDSLTRSANIGRVHSRAQSAPLLEVARQIWMGVQTPATPVRPFRGPHGVPDLPRVAYVLRCTVPGTCPGGH